MMSFSSTFFTTAFTFSATHMKLYFQKSFVFSFLNENIFEQNINTKIMDILHSLNNEFALNARLNRLHPNKHFGVWSIQEDYTLVSYILQDCYAFTTCAHKMNKTRKDIVTRFRKLFNTSDWVKIATTPATSKLLILNFLKINYIDRNNVSQDITDFELVEFLNYYGFY